MKDGWYQSILRFWCVSLIELLNYGDSIQHKIMTKVKKHTSKNEAQHTWAILIAKVTISLAIQCILTLRSLTSASLSVSCCWTTANLASVSACKKDYISSNNKEMLTVCTESNTEVEIYSIIPWVSVVLFVVCQSVSVACQSMSVALPVACPFQHP